MKVLKSRIAWIVAALALASGAVVAVRGGEGGHWVVVGRRDLDRTAAFTGRLAAVNVEAYGPPAVPRVWSYRISFIAPDGREVRTGDVVLRFDTTELQERMRSRIADRDRARTELQQRSSSFEVQRREQELALEEAALTERRTQVAAQVPEELVSRSRLQKSTIELDLARDEVAHRKQRIDFLERRAEAELSSLRERLHRTEQEVAELERAIELMTVRARRGGLVLHRAGDRGERKKVGDSSWQGNVVLEIPQFDEMTVQGWVKEADSGALAAGLEAELRLDASPDRLFRARLDEIGRTVERRGRENPERVVRVVLRVLETDAGVVRPGMRVQGRILLERHVGLAVPVAAVAGGPDGTAVTVGGPWRHETRVVELGRRAGTWVEVLGGLSEGDRVLLWE